MARNGSAMRLGSWLWHPGGSAGILSKGFRAVRSLFVGCPLSKYCELRGSLCNALFVGWSGNCSAKSFTVVAVKISYIGVQHFCRYPIFIHDLWVSVTIGAQCGCAVAEGCSGWIADLVHPMTIGTGGHVQIALISESLAMHAGLVLFVLFTMTLCARLGNMQARSDGQLAALRANDPGLCMWVVAV